MSKKRKDQVWGQDGFESWGGYMAAKKSKLQEQFLNTASKEFKESSKLFEGIAIFVNGYTEPTSDELRRLMMMHGGIYHHYMRPTITTHIIASNLPYSKIIVYRKSQNPIPICKPQWITDSIAAGKILNFQNYLLYSNNVKVQPQLIYKLINKNKLNDSNMHNEQNTEMTHDQANTSNNKSNIINDNMLKHDTINNPLKNDIINTFQQNTKIIAQSTRDSEFLSAFYSNSRLHYIATMGTTFKNYVNELRDKNNGVFSGLEDLRKRKQVKCAVLPDFESDSEDDTICFTNKIGHKQKLVIMHIDMDCFFVSVGIRNKPELKDLPIAVTHAKGNTFSGNYDGKEEFGSLSEVASCSYAARKAGVKNGMFLGEALKMCPNLKTIQYDFEGYKEVSYVLYDTVASYTLDIEAVSCDELYADCTKILEISGMLPMEFATIIREEIKQKTGCPVSTGFGNNKLQARLATRKAKPDNQFYLNSKHTEMYMRTFNVRDLPGVGGTTTQKLNSMNVHTCEELQHISLGMLQKEFGKKMGEQLYKMCRGIDDTKLNVEHIRKSVSAEVNYGIRFQNNNDAIDFLSKLSTEVCNRLIAAYAKGRCITLKLMIRAEEAAKETAKFMGHGLCNYITKSKNLIAAVDDLNIIKKEVISIWNQLHLIPEDMRGIGIQISRLEICKSKKNKTNLTNFFNKLGKSQMNETLQHSSKNQQCDLQFNKNSNTNSSEASSNVALGLPQFFEKVHNEHVVNPSISETNQSMLKVEVKNEKLQNNTNGIVTQVTKTKEMPVKSNKTLIKKQTSQENFFRQMKPSSGRTSKYEVPKIQDIDMSVLVELPDDIRNEILNEYKNNKQEYQVSTTTDTANLTEPLNKIRIDSNAQESCSQIDLDVLSSLMKNDLHPDVRRDVQIYCNMKKEANSTNFTEIDKGNGVTVNMNKELSREKIIEKKSGPSWKTDNDKNMKFVTSKNNIELDVCMLQTDVVSHVKNPLHKKDDTNKIESVICRTDFTDTLHNNTTANKADTFILQNLNILHNNENIDKHQEMLINLVNHLFTLPLQQIKMQIQTWVIESKIVNEVDFLSLATFLSMLPQKKRIEDLHILLKTMHRCTTKTENCVWHKTYRKTVKHVQRYMQIMYNSNLMVPSIRCNNFRCNNAD